MKFIPGTKFINNTRKNTRHFQRGVLHVLNNVSFNKEDNITIKLPFSNYEQSLKQYKILEDEGKIYKNSIVDLRVPKKIIISYK